jgi:hypothetical protein
VAVTSAGKTPTRVWTALAKARRRGVLVVLEKRQWGPQDQAVSRGEVSTRGGNDGRRLRTSRREAAMPFYTRGEMERRFAHTSR